MILEFVELDDFVNELKELQIELVRCEISVETGTAHGDIGIATIVARAVCTAMSDPTYMIRWERDILVSDTLSYRHDKDESRKKMFSNFEKVRAEIEARGFRVKRGEWKE